ncbi:ribosome biogenesis GTP-binding protein YihA/YsxC [Candidatus Synchoanobacter obligatus]|uniref:Probable GTP-binding protein EngB n=1 Tax=Candidatus Synchoanobacter obligatus TaxID=2919597 RepID=A0ABT1L4S3_9GAMM|nr:ribosome biogenesis GTP-binding protein YihA/YsxC [Candidatus Synchoanobacter obligatus]MCP8352179.1 ribosome biogenesis GTP-binding protein YihA/YsxC [Candidatus Synchoanobacter obligatus]
MTPLQLKFLKSAPSIRDLPEDTGHEIIMAGYSNVGKSSIINAIANIKNLAKCSKTPGRTQLFNVFTCPNNSRVIDLPGYGFAQVSRAKQASWAIRLQEYLEHRKCLSGLIIIVDIRRGLRPIDLDIIGWCYDQGVDYSIALNKADKLSRKQCIEAQQKILQTIEIDASNLILCSCLKKTGIDALQAKLRKQLDI